MESIEVIVAHPVDPTTGLTQPVVRRVVSAPVERRVVVAVQVKPAEVKRLQNRERKRRWDERQRLLDGAQV